jgi:hypothetical protein
LSECSGLALLADIAQEFVKLVEASFSFVQSPNWHMNVGALKEILCCSYLLSSGPEKKNAMATHKFFIISCCGIAH